MHTLRIKKALALAGVALGILSGLAAGIGGYTFIYARGASYLTNQPEACANCHVMREQFEGWSRGSHHAVAVCNDCHTPAGLIPKYLTKAINGFHHSLAFTTGRFPDTIQIHERNRQITEQACRKCHQEIVQAIDPPHRGGDVTQCLRCHPSVGHLE